MPALVSDTVLPSVLHVAGTWRSAPFSASQAVSLPAWPGISKVVPRISSSPGADGAVSGSSPHAATSAAAPATHTRRITPLPVRRRFRGLLVLDMQIRGPAV